MICFNLHLQCERESTFSCQHSSLCRPHALRRQRLREQGKGEISNEDSATVAASLTVAVVYFFKESFRRG